MTDDLNLMGDARPSPHFVSGYDQIIFIPLSLQDDCVIGILLEIELGCFPYDITLNSGRPLLHAAPALHPVRQGYGR